MKRANAQCRQINFRSDILASRWRQKPLTSQNSLRKDCTETGAGKPFILAKREQIVSLNYDHKYQNCLVYVLSLIWFNDLLLKNVHKFYFKFEQIFVFYPQSLFPSSQYCLFTAGTEERWLVRAADQGKLRQKQRPAGLCSASPKAQSRLLF